MRYPTGGGLADTETLTQTQACEMMKNTSTGFIKNVGQVLDFNRNVAPQVLYVLHGKNVNVFLTPSGLTYSLMRFKNDFSQNLPVDELNHNRLLENSKEQQSFVDIARLDLILKDATILKENITEDNYTKNSAINYYGSPLGDEALNLHACSQITIKNIYPNIDWVLKINEKEGFKYDFIVHPGGATSDIKLQYKGCADIKLNEEKNKMAVYTPLGLIDEGKLICYTASDKSKVNATYQLNNCTATINVNEYNKNETLIIDPVVELELTWSTFFGGDQFDEATAVAVDTIYDFVYVVGNTDSQGGSFPLLNNSTAYFVSNASYTSQTDCFIACFDLAGVQQWTTHYFSTELDKAADVTTDYQGNIYVVGQTATTSSSTIKFKTQNAGGFYQATPGAGATGCTDGFIIKFSTTGILIWASLYGGNDYDHCVHITCDKSDNVIMVGNTLSNNLNTTNAGGYYNNSFNASGVWDLFIARFDNTTTDDWITYFGSNTNDWVTSVVCDEAERIIVTGMSDYNTTVTLPIYKASSLTNAYYQTSSNGTINGIIAVFEANTSQRWCTYFGGNNSFSIIKSVDYNSKYDRIVIAGYTNSGSSNSSGNFPVVNNASTSAYYQNTNPSGSSSSFLTGFIAEFNGDYSQRWCTFLGDDGDNRLFNVSYSYNGHIFVMGYSGGYVQNATSFIPTVNAYSLVPFKGSMYNTASGLMPSDLYVAQFYNDCSLQWATLFGKDDIGENFEDIEVAGNNVYACGYWGDDVTSPYNYTVHEPGGFLCTSPQGGGDGFIWKLKDYEGEDLREANIKEQPLHFNVYPNPANRNDVRISINQSSEELKSILVIDATGRILLNTKTTENNLLLQLPENLSGHFVLKVISKTWSAQQALIKF